jgi:hypothetical protein
MTKREKEIAALKKYVEVNVITINEAREKLGESRIDNPIADQLLHYTKEFGWRHFPGGEPVRGEVQKLLPKAFDLVTEQ